MISMKIISVRAAGILSFQRANQRKCTVRRAIGREVRMKKNCTNCKHLEWVDGDDIHGHGSGFDCNKRYDEMSQAGREEELISNLNRDAYRELAKRCHEPTSQ